MKTLLKVVFSLAIIATFGFSYQYIYGSNDPRPQTISEEMNLAEVEEIETTEGEISVYTLVREKLTVPYTKKSKRDVPKGKMFSRCPSGFRAWVEEEPETETEYSYGQMNYFEGCDEGELICHFRARLSDKTVDVLQSDSVTYIAAQLWIEQNTASK